jgi:creatinine amidohydrolase
MQTIMNIPSRFWADWTTTDFAQIDSSSLVAVLPVGAIEQHGPHLPLSVDADLTAGLVQACLPQLTEDAQVVFLPAQVLGYSPEHAAFAGTLTLKAETVMRMWTDIAESVAAAGVKKLVIFNSHGGQVSMMDVVARDWRARLGLLVYSVSWFNLPLLHETGQDVSALFSAQEHRFGVHAGDMETSMMLALRPELVRMDRAQHFHSSAKERAARYPLLGNGKSAKLAWQMQDYNLQGAAGNAAAATAEKGQALVQAAARSLARLLAEVQSLPVDTLQRPIQA